MQCSSTEYVYCVVLFCKCRPLPEAHHYRTRITAGRDRQARILLEMSALECPQSMETFSSCCERAAHPKLATILIPLYYLLIHHSYEINCSALLLLPLLLLLLLLEDYVCCRKALWETGCLLMHWLSLTAFSYSIAYDMPHPGSACVAG